MIVHQKIGPVPEYWERSVVNSALWAAAGDALGWITELANGPNGVKRRVGADFVAEPIRWQRTVGGRMGPKVDLPAGTYSDDTQLRLAVSRSIRSNGFFDVETFAKIELTVWPTYALGAGLGTKAAALGLSKRGVNWFSNFFEIKGQKYINGGGNGAAMRIQPHVWSSGLDYQRLILDVLRNSVATHGHPHGFAGAVFHAVSLANTLIYQEVPRPDQWLDQLQYISDISNLVMQDSQLAVFWITAWENMAGTSLQLALDNMLKEACRDIDAILDIIDQPSPDHYKEVLRRIGCNRPEFRGSGFKTALAALALSYMFRNERIEFALRCAANEIESDTDTIATMAGAILGGIASEAPTWEIQDREYITREAVRLAAVAAGKGYDDFFYPDIGLWNPPTSQAASIGRTSVGLGIVGLGNLTPIGVEYFSGEAVWQWFRLPFGQSVLAKRRIIDLDIISTNQMPIERKTFQAYREKINSFSSNNIPKQKSLQLNILSEAADQPIPQPGIDELTDLVIASNFDDLTLGRILNQCIDFSQSIDQAVAIAAIVAKAKISRQKRKR